MEMYMPNSQRFIMIKICQQSGANLLIFECVLCRKEINGVSYSFSFMQNIGPHLQEGQIFGETHASSCCHS